MGLFDRFRKRVHEVAEQTDADALSADEGSEEAQAALVAAGQQPQSPSHAPVQEPPSPLGEAEEEWEDLDALDPVETTPDDDWDECCLLYTSPSPRDATLSRMPSSA